MTELADRVVYSGSNVLDNEFSPGKRLRAFSSIISRSGTTIIGATFMDKLLLDAPADITYQQAMRILIGDAHLAHISLRGMAEGPALEAIPEDFVPSRANPTLHAALQDLADEIVEDVRDACEVLDHPDLWYPGVDEGIEPVPDEHVTLVIWGLQRELNRELRGLGYQAPKRPAVQLAEFPWHIQRAIVERRRLRFAQWGIGRAEYEANEWSVWRVPEEPDFVPRRVLRRQAAIQSPEPAVAAQAATQMQPEDPWYGYYG